MERVEALMLEEQGAGLAGVDRAQALLEQGTPLVSKLNLEYEEARALGKNTGEECYICRPQI